MSCAEMAELIEMPFGSCTCVGPKNRVFGFGLDPHRERGNFGGISQPAVKYRECLA